MSGQFVRLLLLAGVTVLVGSPVHAESDVLIQAVGFALTGSDNAKVRTINRKDCVFAIGDDTYYLNNVQVDRLAFEKWESKNPAGIVVERWLTAELHGHETVYETIERPEPPPRESDYPAKFVEELKRSDPNFFNQKAKPAVRKTSKQASVRLATSETDRINRAWQYIYANGCVGTKSPF